MNVRVFLNHFGSRMPVGILAQQGHEILFQYAPDFLERNIALSSYFLPLRSEIFCDHKHTFDGLFGVFHDSLPDGWGLLLLDRVLSRIGRSLAQTSPLERLTLAGSNAMGALEYEPDMSSANPEEVLMDPDTLARESERLLGEHSYKGGYIDTLLSLSGSLSGARPKISISLPDRNGLPVPWIVKFRSLQDAPDAGLQEYRLSLATQKAGVDMPQTRLLPSKTCEGFFAIKRFDRTFGKNGILKIHTHSACGLLHASHRLPTLDYENLIRLTMDLTKDARDVEKMVRLMIFNVKAGNRDDHSKNFSFLMDETFHWHLAPAYDITSCPGINGEHCSAVNGKGKDITGRDLAAAAAVGGISANKVKLMIEQTEGALNDSLKQHPNG